MRRLLNLLTPLSLVVCLAGGVLWLRSYEPKPRDTTLAAGRWHVENLRGQIWLLRHRPNPDPSSLRTNVLLILSRPHPAALIKGMVFDRTAPWDEKLQMPGALLSRPYVIVNLRDGI